MNLQPSYLLNSEYQNQDEQELIFSNDNSSHDFRINRLGQKVIYRKKPVLADYEQHPIGGLKTIHD